MVGQSDPLFVPTSVMKTPTPSTDDPAQEDLLQKYQERVERLSQQNRVIKICTDAGFLTTVDVGQYFMTKDTEEFSQFTESVACREYTLPRDENSSEPKGWIRGNTQIGPVLEVTTSDLQRKYGVELRNESVNGDNSHSWVRISQQSTWKHGVLHRTSRKRGRNIKTLCIGSTSNLLKRKYLSSIKHDRMESSFKKHFQLIVSRRLSLWKLVKSYTRKYMRHFGRFRRVPLETIG